MDDIVQGNCASHLYFLSLNLETNIPQIMFQQQQWPPLRTKNHQTLSSVAVQEINRKPCSNYDDEGVHALPQECLEKLPCKHAFKNMVSPRHNMLFKPQQLALIDHYHPGSVAIIILPGRSRHSAVRMKRADWLYCQQIRSAGLGSDATAAKSPPLGNRSGC